MELNQEINKVLSDRKLFIKMVLDAWQSYYDRVSKLIEKLSDEELALEIAPGRNTATYLLGHLTAVHDNLFPLFGLGPKQYPELGKIFIDSPDKSGHVFPPTSELRKYWQDLHTRLNSHLFRMTADDWFSKHNSVSDEDFEKEPHRNKLNVLMNRTNHLSNHYGQMLLLAKRGA